MTQEYIEKEMIKAGWISFKGYLLAIYHVSCETFTNWPKEEQWDALKDFFSSLE